MNPEILRNKQKTITINSYDVRFLRYTCRVKWVKSQCIFQNPYTGVEFSTCSDFNENVLKLLLLIQGVIKRSVPYIKCRPLVVS